MESIKTIIAEQLSKHGLSFLLLGVAVFYLWGKQEDSEKEWKQELSSIKLQNKECQTTYQNLLLDQLTKTTNVIEDNTDVLRKISESK